MSVPVPAIYQAPAQALPELGSNRAARRKHERQRRLYFKHETKRTVAGLQKCALCKRKIVKHPDGKPCEFTVEVEGTRYPVAGTTEDLRQTIAAAYAGAAG